MAGSESLGISMYTGRKVRGGGTGFGGFGGAMGKVADAENKGIA